MFVIIFVTRLYKCHTLHKPALYTVVRFFKKFSQISKKFFPNFSKNFQNFPKNYRSVTP